MAEDATAKSEEAGSLMDKTITTMETGIDKTTSPKASDALLNLYTSAFEDLRELVYCKVCVRPMYEPYTVACGHTFCYSCLLQWFQSHPTNMTCPDCRASVYRMPAPSYVVSLHATRVSVHSLTSSS